MPALRLWFSEKGVTRAGDAFLQAAGAAGKLHSSMRHFCRTSPRPRWDLKNSYASRRRGFLRAVFLPLCLRCRSVADC
jgi:hypothetical protein